MQLAALRRRDTTGRAVTEDICAGVRLFLLPKIIVPKDQLRCCPIRNTCARAVSLYGAVRSLGMCTMEQSWADLRNNLNSPFRVSMTVLPEGSCMSASERCLALISTLELEYADSMKWVPQNIL